MKRNRLETVESLASRFGLPARTIHREVMRCRLPYVSVAGNWRFRELDVELWLHRVGPLPRLRLLRAEAVAETAAEAAVPQSAEARR